MHFATFADFIVLFVGLSPPLYLLDFRCRQLAIQIVYADARTVKNLKKIIGTTRLDFLK